MVLDRGGWWNTGKDVTGIFGPTITTENISVLAFHQILHSKVPVLIVMGKHGVHEPTDALLLRGFGRVVASTVIPRGLAREPRHSQGLGGFILPHAEDSCVSSMRERKEGNGTRRSQLDHASIGKFSWIRHTGFKEGFCLKLSF